MYTALCFRTQNEVEPFSKCKGLIILRILRR